jgi:hypothetical protein
MITRGMLQDASELLQTVWYFLSLTAIMSILVSFGAIAIYIVMHLLRFNEYIVW